MQVLNYRIFLKKEQEGGYTVIVPSLPGYVTYGIESVGGDKYIKASSFRSQNQC